MEFVGIFNRPVFPEANSYECEPGELRNTNRTTCPGFGRSNTSVPRSAPDAAPALKQRRLFAVRWGPCVIQSPVFRDREVA
jgi:hypothetical protein